MVATTPVFGREVPKPLLSSGILAFYGALGFYFSRPGPNAPGPTQPKIEASSTEEEDFIKKFIADAEKSDKAEPKHH